MSVLYYETYDPSNDFLMHHGIKGQKWGIRRTAEQLGHFAKRAYETGKEAYGKASTTIKAYREKRIETGKQKAILSANYNEIMKYKSHMTDEELDHALSRFDTSKKIDDLARENAKAVVERGVQTIETIARVGLAVNKIRQASAEFKKTRATARKTEAEAKKQRLENEQKTRDLFNQTVDSNAKNIALNEARNKVKEIMNDTSYRNDRERSKAAKRALDSIMDPFTYKSRGQKTKETIDRGGAAGKKAVDTSEAEIYEFIKKRMGRG